MSANLHLSITISCGTQEEGERAQTYSNSIPTRSTTSPIHNLISAIDFSLIDDKYAIFGKYFIRKNDVGVGILWCIYACVELCEQVFDCLGDGLCWPLCVGEGHDLGGFLDAWIS